MSEIKTVGVAGSGTMGAGIAIVAARAGYKTIVFDTRQAALDSARKQTAGFFAKSVERKKLTQDQVDKIMGDLSGTTSLADMAACDIVIEAVFESLKVKHELFSELNKVCPQTTLFASNTSTLSITEIAGGSGRDDRFVGMHVCLPAQLMKLVEMSPGIRTLDSYSIIFWCRSTTTRSASSSRAWQRPPMSTVRSRPVSAIRWGHWSCSTWWDSIRNSCCARPCTALPMTRARRVRHWSNA